MDGSQFDRIARSLGGSRSRRAATALLGALAALPLVAFTETAAKKKKKKKGKGKGKGRPKGGTPVCTPQCSGCGGSDGCGATCGCAAGAVCAAGQCQSCTVTCASNEVACGADLSQKLLSGGTIYLCPGRYGGNFSITKPTTMIGAGSGDDPSTSTILDGRLLGRVVDVPATAGTVTLRSLRITNGVVATASGGGVQSAADLEVDRCAVVGNRAKHSAGILTVTSTGRLRLSNSTVSQNTADQTGGGVAIHSAQASFITDSVITDNSTVNLGGGGIDNGSTVVTITRSSITQNRASSIGGGIYNQTGTLVLDATTRITGNSARPALQGGGIQNNGGTVQLNGATVANNTPDNCYAC